ncbi:MAG: TolC family protein [Bacteroidetes bacterium]|nr:TolC family protein [Bacteroidota bacterium]
MKGKTLFFLLLVSGLMPLAAQTNNDTLKLTMRQAIDLALQTSRQVKNAQADVQLARQKVKEIQSIGLPQVNATGGFTQYVQIPGSYVPNFTGQGPDFLFIRFQQKYTSNLNIQASQLLYDGTYLLGLQAAKTFVDISKLMESKSETDLSFAVAKSYALCLNTSRNLELLDQNIYALKKTLEEVSEIYKAGFAEKLDVDRLSLSLSTLVMQRDKLLAGVEMTQNVLKLTMGLDPAKPIILADNLEQLNQELHVTLPTGNEVPKPNNRIEYQLLQQSLRMNYFDEKRYLVGYTPTLVGFMAHQRTTNRSQFNFLEGNLPINNTWVPATLWGLNLSVPIFDGFRKQSQIRQVRINREKTLNDITSFEYAAGMEYLNARQAYMSSLKAIEVQKKNIELAESIYKNVNTKFKEGVGSTIEILSAENELKSARVNYLGAIYDLNIAMMDLKKALGQSITQ